MSDAAANERYARAAAITHAVLDLPADARAAQVDRECLDDAALRAEVAWMLRAACSDEDNGDDDVAFVVDTSGLLDGAALAAIAPREYRVLRPLGEGGMGMVYLAERSEDDLPQRVALKLLRFAEGTSSQRRFREEQRILAGLRHPNIAHFIDAGTLANGQPFLAIEYVDGTSIERWCVSQPLATRLDVFLKVCAAVSHAHAQLVIHRDIKPGNILVTAAGEPKLLDFGIARLVDGGDARTLTATRSLTLAYASPEQIEGAALGTATDVYSLGAVLYEIMTGARPFAEAMTDLALSQAIVGGNLAPPHRIARVPVDVEAIVLKAMRREPAQRYASVAELADDVQRYLASEPVRARRGGLAYRTRRFVRRNRYALAAVALAALLLSAFVVVTVAQLRRTQVQRERADRINAFFDSVLAAADPADMGSGATLAQVLERTQREVEQQPDTDPANAMLTELTLARTWFQIGRADRAQHSAELAIVAAQKARDPTTEIDARNMLGAALWSQGQYAAAETELKQARGMALRSGTGLESGEAAVRLSTLDMNRDRYDQSLEWARLALSELPADAVTLRAVALGNMAGDEYMAGRIDSALELNAQVVAMKRGLYPDGHRELATTLRNRGAMLTRAHRYAEADAALRESLSMMIALYGESHISVNDTLVKLAQLHIQQDDADGAIRYAARAHALAAPLDNYVSARAAKKYALALSLGHRDAEALAAARESVAIYRKHYADGYGELLDAQSVLGLVQARGGDVGAGRALAQDAYKQLLASDGDQHNFTVDAKTRLDEIDALMSTPH